MTYKALEANGLTELISSGGNNNWIIPAGSLWLRIDEATVPALAIKVIRDDDGTDFSLKLGMDFLQEYRARLHDDELYIRMEGNEEDVLVPFILPRLPFENNNSNDNDNDAAKKPAVDKKKHGNSQQQQQQQQQLVMRKQIPCGVVLSANGIPEVHPLRTVVDSSVASSTISREAVNAIGLTEFVQSNHDNNIIPADSFSLRMDEATVPSPLLRVVEAGHDAEYELMLGMFFLREHEAQMKDGDLYIQANGQDEVLVPFIEPRASLSFDDVNDEL
jgi:hypothetical protein